MAWQLENFISELETVEVDLALFGREASSQQAPKALLMMFEHHNPPSAENRAEIHSTDTQKEARKKWPQKLMGDASAWTGRVKMRVKRKRSCTAPFLYWEHIASSLLN